MIKKEKKCHKQLFTTLSQVLQPGDTVIGSYQGKYKGVFVGEIVDIKKQIKVLLYKGQSRTGAGCVNELNEFWTGANYLVKVKKGAFETKLSF